MRISGYFLIILVLIPSLARTEETAVVAEKTKRLNLKTIIVDAKKDNPQIAAAKQEWLAQKAKVNQVRWWPDPQVGIMWEQIPWQTLSLGDASMRMLSISQMFPFPGKLSIRGGMAGLSAEMAAEAYKTTELEITTKAKKLYYELSFIYESIEINKKNKGLLERFVRIAQIKYEVGKAHQHDVLKAQVELSLMGDELITLEREKEITESKLNALLNRLIRFPLGIPKEDRINPFKFKYEELEKTALKNHPELKGMDYAVKRSQSALSLAGMGYLPDFMVTYKQGEMQNMGTMSWDLGFFINFPLWFWKQASAVSEKEADKKAVEASYQSMKNMVVSKVQEAWAEAESAWRRVDLFQSSVLPQARQTMDAATAAYETDKIDFLALINSQKMLQDVELKYHRAIMKYAQGLAEVERAIGMELKQEVSSESFKEE